MITLAKEFDPETEKAINFVLDNKNKIGGIISSMAKDTFLEVLEEFTKRHGNLSAEGLAGFVKSILEHPLKTTLKNVVIRDLQNRFDSTMPTTSLDFYINLWRKASEKN